MTSTARQLPRWVPAALAAALAVVLLAAGGLFWLNRAGAGSQSDLPTLGTLPDFQLTDQAGRAVSAKELQGKVLAISLIYTHCTDICPVITQQMRSVQVALKGNHALGEDVFLLSITVDPERDTPEVLAQYAADHHADLETWSFLTGDVNHVRDVVVNGLLLGMTKMASSHAGHGSGDAAEDYNVSHSGRVVLVDKTGQIRSYFEGTEVNPTVIAEEIMKLR